MKTQLEKEFNKLNKKYKNIDTQMNRIARTENVEHLENQLENIQKRMSEISTILENL